MNIVLLYDGYRKGDDRTRVDFFKKLRRLCNFYICGPKEYELDPNFAPLKYTPKLMYADLIKEFKADLFIMLLYSVDAINFEMDPIGNIGVPFIVIGEDHYRPESTIGEKVLNWYKEKQFHLILRRHCYPEKYQLPNSVWFPFSGNEEEFFIDNTIEKKNSIGFAGSWKGNEYYDIRYKALQILLYTHLLDTERNGRIWGKEYITYMQSHIGCLSCSGGSIHTPLAKTFEIPMCGSALLTNHIDHSDLLFGNKQCYFEYKDNCSDIIDKANTILHDHDYVNEVVNNMNEQINLKHTDSKRLLEFYNIAEALVAGKTIPRIWGQ